MDWSIFPSWMGIDSWGTFIGVVILYTILSCFYIIVGWIVTPKSIKSKWIKGCIIITWPVSYAIVFVCFPIILFYYLLNLKKEDSEI